EGPPRLRIAGPAPAPRPTAPGRTRMLPTRETVLFKDRLLYLLQPSLENLFAGKRLNLPFQPYPYQMKGIAFLMPRARALVTDEKCSFDLMILDEAQRIKTRESKTSQVVRSVRRKRSWAMSGTPIENKPEDLVNIFAFVDPQRIPPETPTQRLPELTADCIL